ncbi:MAG: twin-arginine translocase TatA/TatE family subunit [Solirubrobacterales bacterium]
MPNIGPLEIIVVLALALLIFGPKRLPELGRSLGNGIREFRGSISGDNDDDDEPPRELNTGSSASATPVESEPQKSESSSTTDA